MYTKKSEGKKNNLITWRCVKRDPPVSCPATLHTTKNYENPEVVEVKQLEGLLSHICNNGFEHHVAMNHSSTGAVLHEAFTKYLGVECYKHS